MGTRADFYVGVGKGAEWFGSIAFDGYEWAGDETEIGAAKTEAEYRAAVSAMLASRTDATTPDMGWPWPWDDSSTTDYAYTFADGKVSWDERNDWPDMKDRKAFTLGPRSGVIVITPKR